MGRSASTLATVGRAHPADGAASGLRSRPRGVLHLLETWHGSPRRPLPVLADAAVTAGVAAVVTGAAGSGGIVAATWVAAGLLFGLYRPRTPLEIQGVVWYPIRSVPVGLASFAVLASGVDGVTTTEAWQVALLAVVALTSVRAILWIAISAARRRGRGLRPTLVIGPGDRVSQIEHRLRTYVEAGLAHESSYIPTPGTDHDPAQGKAIVDRLLADHDVDHVLVVADAHGEAIFRDIVRFAGNRVDCGLVLPVPGIAAGQTRGHLGDLPVIPIRTSPSSGSDLAKRVFDLVIATVGLLAMSPILIGIGLAIRIDNPGPAIFRQRRVGRFGQSFTVYKFRSMVVDAESRRGEHLASNINADGLLFKLENDPRITPVGAVIRRLSIDEIPQLLNVINGTMSLVGPRPLPVDPDEFDVPAQIRHQVKPGITGLWQVHGANALPYADMVDLDMTYVTTRSMGLDLAVLARTLPAVVFRRVKAI